MASKINSKDKRRKVKALVSKSGLVCHWCSAALSWGDSDYPTLDHYVPQSRGGSNKLSNLVLACDWCNQKRGNKTPNQFKGWLEKHWVAPEKRRRRKL